MRSHQRESSLFVCRQFECRWPEAIHRMATLAAIIVRRHCKFTFVEVLVAIETLSELDLVLRVLASRLVALYTFGGRVLSLEGISGGFMFHDAEARRPEAFYRVTALALATIGAFSELAAVRVRFVAVGALGKRDGLLEVAVRMALFAGDG